jgi:endonuclease III
MKPSHRGRRQRGFPWQAPSLATILARTRFQRTREWAVERGPLEPDRPTAVPFRSVRFDAVTTRAHPFLDPGSSSLQPTITLMATQSKSQLLTDVHALLKRRYKPKADPNTTRLSVLKAVVYGICHEDTTREQANQAISRFNDEFFDWNEIRVSSLEEIQESLAGIAEPEPKAKRIRRFLRQLFKRTYAFNLDALVKKPLKDALKVLQTYEAFSSDYVTATVIQQALGGHAIPVDKATCRVLHRLGISEPDVSALRAIVERAVPKNRGVEFLDLIEDLANDTCVEETPDCPHCELRKICAFAQTHKGEAPQSPPARPTKESSKPVKAAKPVDAEPPLSPAPAKKMTYADDGKAPPHSPPSPARGKHDPK